MSKSELERIVEEQIKTLVPHYDTLELNAMVKSYCFSVEFFATVDGKRMQCFEMMDAGMFTQKKFNAVCRAIANYCRGLPDFNKNGVNTYEVVLK